MSKYILKVVYTYGSLTVQREFRARAKGINYAKEQFHRYTHENYKNVDRSEEDEHIHTLAESAGVKLEQTLMEVKEVDEFDQGIIPISRV